MLETGFRCQRRGVEVKGLLVLGFGGWGSAPAGWGHRAGSGWRQVVVSVNPSPYSPKPPEIARIESQVKPHMNPTHIPHPNPKPALDLHVSRAVPNLMPRPPQPGRKMLHRGKG